ncbi:type II secretion system minor pseudopilin GspH [Psychrosphaera ytuae]|uniref:Type II secretion system protein H n=1 Tax=Psychrosphaera ytuae TaxID=2820710 RepID=A0A975D9V6_9GAMM|nr:type II secretion system minor pseudopilin GspH [Psychrosphaera ytuae]QTH62874.1 type II secretion system minor pseudopilin GspH [Psychrosphaera ytuae]
MKKAHGFTLIELLLVIVIIGYLVSLVRFPSLSKSPFDEVEMQANKLTALVNLASEQALIHNKQLGLSVGENQYAFLEFTDGKWQPITVKPFKTEPLPEDVTLTLKLDGLSWSQDNLISSIEMIDEERLEALAELPEEERLLAFPQVFILSSGEISPFDIEVTYDDFDTSVMFLVRGKFTAPVHVYDPRQQEDLDE